MSDAVRANSELYLEWLKQACAIPSLASNPEGLERMVGWLEDRFADLGARVERLRHENAPAALLATLGDGPRTVLIYNHYDVQPVDPIDLWASPPFEPTLRDGALFARGVGDNKGDLVARLAALHAYLEAHGSLPCRVKFLVEGEEETGSESFHAIVASHGDKLTADGCIWEGDGIDHAGRAEIVMGAKGLVYVELIHRGLAEDQHSSLAAIAPSPVWHLVEALATLRAPDGRILIDGFYDDVDEASDEDLELLRSFPYDEEAERSRLGVDEFVAGARGLEFLRRRFFEPTCNIAGLVAGFIEPGASKTVLPKEASAKIDMRLVPRQDPHDIVAKLRKHLDQRGFDDIEIATYGAEPPVRTPMDSLVARAVVGAAEKCFPAGQAISPMMIGAGPMYPIASTLGIPISSPAGVCRPDCNIHAPNEKCRVDDFLTIAAYTTEWLDAYAAL